MYNTCTLVIKYMNIAKCYVTAKVPKVIMNLFSFIGQLPNSKQAEPKTSSQLQSKDNSNTYLNIQKLHAAYAPKKTDNKSNTAVLLPQVSSTSLTTDNNSNHLRSTPSSPRKHQHELELNVSVISPRSSLSHKLLNSDDDKVKKIYLSDAHSGMITGVPCAPPCTPTDGM